jgi:flagellar hook-length control protein FliK
MIKPSTPSPASLAPARPPAPTDEEARASGREDGDAAFNDVMEAQAPRDEAGVTREPARRDEDADARAAGPADPSPEAAGAMDPMLGLCLPQPAELASAAATVASASGPARSGGVAATQAAAAAVDVTASGLVADVRATLDGLRQSRMPSATDATEIVAGLGVDGALQKAGDDQGPASPAGATPTITPAESRPGSRATGLEAAQPPARPPELRAPLGSGAWTDELGARVTWMVDRGDQFASLRLSPENLGPLEVRIAVREGETSVWFGAAQAETRAALEQSLPRLREMLGASGLSLADAGVFSHTPRDPQRGFTTAALARASQESGVDATGAIVMQVSNRGLVDLYA